MITNKELLRLKEAAENVRSPKMGLDYFAATILSLIEQIAKFKEQLDLLDDPNGFYTEARNQIRDSALEEAAKVAEAKAEQYKAEFDAPASAANSFCEIVLDTPAGYATYHAFKTLLPMLATELRALKSTTVERKSDENDKGN